MYMGALTGSIGSMWSVSRECTWHGQRMTGCEVGERLHNPHIIACMLYMLRTLKQISSMADMYIELILWLDM